MLEVSALHVSIGAIEIIRDAQLSLGERQFSGLIGRNGAGKTTTLRSIMGLLLLDGGRILLDDLDLATVPSFQRASLGIGYAPEDRRLIAEFSVEENLLLPAIALNLPTAERKRRLAEIYALLPEVAALHERPAGVLSGGQGKMVALGRALVAGTRYVLLDEPFQGLAPALAISYADALMRLRRSRPELGMLITESTPKLLDKIVDSALTIERGEVS